MAQITLQAYAPYENKSHAGEMVISIRKADLAGVNFTAGKTTFAVVNCNFEKLIVENNEEIPFSDISLSFFNCFIQTIQIQNITSQNISVGFYSSILSGTIQGTALKSINLNNCLLVGPVFLMTVQRVGITFTKENVNPYRWKQLFQRLNISNRREFISADQSYYIYGAEFLDFNTNFNNANFNLLFNISLTIDFQRSQKDSMTSIQNAYLKSLSMRGNSMGKVAIESSQINSWYISEFYPKEEVNFYDITPIPSYINDSKIEIHKCNLDNVWFDNVSFVQYRLISFYRTKFSKTVFTACNFPNEYSKFEKFRPIKNVHYPDKVTENYQKDQYEIFIQLKKSLEATANYYESQKLQSIAHEALRRIKNISAWDRTILSVNRWSNNHGLSIKRPLGFFILFTVILYVLYLLSLGRIFNSNSVDYKLVGAYFSFIDLTHRTDFLVEKTELTPWSLTIDFFNKIIAGFFIYQFIAAFRKYGKS